MADIHCYRCRVVVYDDSPIVHLMIDGDMEDGIVLCKKCRDKVYGFVYEVAEK